MAPLSLCPTFPPQSLSLANLLFSLEYRRRTQCPVPPDRLSLLDGWSLAWLAYLLDVYALSKIVGKKVWQGQKLRLSRQLE